GPVLETALAGIALQWGRRVNAAEVPLSYQRPQAAPSASMGPPRERGGSDSTGVWLGMDNSASMGPPRERGGSGVMMRVERVVVEELQWGRRVNAAEVRGGGNWERWIRRSFNGAA